MNQYMLPFETYVLTMRRAGAEAGRMSFDYAVVSSNPLFIDDETQGDGLNQVSYHGRAWMRTGDIHYSEGADDDAFYLVKFRGRQATIVGGRNVDRGIAAFSVCDAAGAACSAETFVDAYASTLQIKQQLWTSPLLDLGEHSIKVRATGMHNSAIASPASIIDFDRATID